jgi:hypothetical protein
MTVHWHDDDRAWCPCDEPEGATAPSGASEPDAPAPDAGEPLTAEEFVDHLVNCMPDKPDAWIVCDKGVSGDGPIETMLATGMWRLSDRVEYVGGKRIRHLVPVTRDLEQA